MVGRSIGSGSQLYCIGNKQMGMIMSWGREVGRRLRGN